MGAAVTSLLQLRPAPPPLPQWLAEAVPYAYEEAGKVQFAAMPGICWIRDKSTPNGRGFYRGPRDAVELVAATLESAGVCKVRSEISARPVVQCGPLDFDHRLREYQAGGVAWCRWMLRHTGGALLADEMGLGKTPQAIAALDGFDSMQRLVVCPAIVVPHWEAELARWGDPDNGWHVISWDRFARQQSGKTEQAKDFQAQQWSAAVFDEGHYASNPKAQRTKAAHAWRKAHPEVPTLVLTGTPMSTKPIDLWSILELLWPGRFGSWWDFGRRYCNGHHEDIVNAAGQRITNAEGEPLRPAWKCDGISRPEELRTRLAHCMLRRTKQQVGAELPPRTRVIVPVQVAAAAKRDYRAAAASMATVMGRGEIGSLLRNVEPHKLDAAEALARDVLAAGSRPLLLTTRRDSAFELGTRLGCPAVTGEDDATDRRAKIADAPAACATLYSVETGINLTGFDCIIFVGLDWVPSKILQGEARIHRIGQDKPCTIYYLIAKGTIDEVIQERVITRLENFNAITGAAGDELGLAHDLAPETEDELIAAIVAAVKRKATCMSE